jgi:hypothetical protein
MVIEYQRADAHLLDYELHTLPGCVGLFRGPPPPPVIREYVACVGGAQTFGRFVRVPFPRLLAASLDLETLNLGRGGVGPTYPLNSPGVLDYINRARVAIVQVFSGRSQSNSLFRTWNDSMYGINCTTGSRMSADEFYTWLMGQELQLAQQIVAETCDNYVSDMVRLLAAIKVPKILFWFAARSPDYARHWKLPLQKLWGRFPQFVNRAMVDQLRSHADAYVECSSRRGFPQSVVDTDGNASLNHYYPSVEMHEDAARLLLPASRSLLDGRPQ